jgi:hypothetical protein
MHDEYKVKFSEDQVCLLNRKHISLDVTAATRFLPVKSTMFVY